MVGTNICGALSMAPDLYSFEVAHRSKLLAPVLLYFSQFLQPANNVRIWSDTKRHNVYIEFRRKSI
jgi:hypothetical protein